MLSDHFFYNCSKEYVEQIHLGLFSEINIVISKLQKRNIQVEINADLFCLLTDNSWAYDSMPQRLADMPKDEGRSEKVMLQRDNHRYMCSTSTTLNAA